MHWHPDVTIGMMTAAATLAAQSIPTALHNKTTSGEGGLFPYTAKSLVNPQRQMPTAAAHVAHAYPVTGLGAQPPPRRQLPTVAGYTDGASRASGSRATQLPTIAG